MFEASYPPRTSSQVKILLSFLAYKPNHLGFQFPPRQSHLLDRQFALFKFILLLAWMQKQLAIGSRSFGPLQFRTKLLTDCLRPAICAKCFLTACWHSNQ